MKTLAYGMIGFMFVCSALEASEMQDVPMHTTPIQVSIWNPIQLVPEDWNVCGLRLNLPYGKNRKVAGIDLGLVNFANALEGIQLGLFNLAMGVDGHARAPADIFIDSTGVQIGLFNNSFAGDFSGVQIGGYNSSANFSGVQIAGNFNTAKSFTGLQVSGLANDNGVGGRGVQIALLYNANAAPITISFGSSESFAGIQIAGIWNHNGDVESRGLQLAALVNISKNIKGAQFALVNIADKMTGVQIGLVNIIMESPVVFFPVVNAHF